MHSCSVLGVRNLHNVLHHVIFATVFRCATHDELYNILTIIDHEASILYNSVCDNTCNAAGESLIAELLEQAAQ